MKSDFVPDRTDRITLMVMACCVAGLLVVTALNGLVEFGAVAHDVFCPEHGWAVARA